jgi:urease accessory protein
MVRALRPAAALLVPAAFMVMMATGAPAGFAGIKLPFSEAGVLASIFILGALVMAAVRLPLATTMLLVGGFAMLHGYAHAIEALAGDRGRYIVGFLTATALLQAVGLGLGKRAQRLVGDLGLWAMGGLILVGGAYVLVAN